MKAKRPLDLAVPVAVDWCAVGGPATNAAVRKDLDHLSPRDRDYLERSVRFIRSEFAAALKKKRAVDGTPRRILKIILYGSHVRGRRGARYGDGL